LIKNLSSLNVIKIEIRKPELIHAYALTIGSTKIALATK
jgi:hypothetical protein